MIIPDRAVSVNPFSQTFSKTLRISMIIAKGGAHSLFILSKGQTFRRYSGSPQTLLCACAATPFGRAAKRELWGPGSVRFSANVWL